MNDNLLKGNLVHLRAVNSTTDAEAFSRWSRDSEYMRLSDASTVRMWTIKQATEYIEKEFETESPTMYAFAIWTREESRSDRRNRFERNQLGKR